MRMLRGSGIAGLAAMARQSRARRRGAGAPVSACREIAADGDLQEGQDRLCRRSDQPRHEFHPAADPRSDAGAGGRGRRCAQPGAAGFAAGPGQCGGGNSGRRRRALSGAEGSRTRSRVWAGLFDANAFAALPEEIRLRLLLRAIDASATKGRQNSARSRRCWRRWTGAAAERGPRSGRTAETDPRRAP